MWKDLKSVFRICGRVENTFIFSNNKCRAGSSQFDALGEILSGAPPQPENRTVEKIKIKRVSKEYTIEYIKNKLKISTKDKYTTKTETY